MTTALIADTPVDVDAEGFLVDAEQWNERIAEEVARENGVEELTERHWLVVRFMRDRWLETGNAPSIRALGKESGVPVKELYELFPKGHPVGSVISVEQLVGDQQRLHVAPAVRFDRLDVVWVVLAGAPEADPDAEAVPPGPRPVGL